MANIPMEVVLNEVNLSISTIRNDIKFIRKEKELRLYIENLFYEIFPYVIIIADDTPINKYEEFLDKSNMKGNFTVAGCGFDILEKPDLKPFYRFIFFDNKDDSLLFRLAFP